MRRVRPRNAAKAFRQIRRRLIPLLALAALLTACSARRLPTPPVAAAPGPVAAPAPPPVDVPALIERGCFTCLERALAEARRRDAPDLIFEAATLLAMRAKELGLPHQDWVDAATRAAAGDTARTGLLEIVAAMPLDPLSGGSGGLPTRGLARARIDTVGVNAWIEGLATAPGSPPFRHYLTLALRCSSAGPVTNPAATVPDGVRTVPLVRYRLGICGNAHGDELRAVRAADAEFVDADYVLGQYALQLRPYPDADEAARRFQSAAAAFPASPAIATSLGDVQQEIEDWNAALRAYDAALALVGDHPEALRGRTIVQATAGDYLGAIETATKLMARQVYLGEAFYWRAWSHFQLGHHEIARADADRMKTLRLNSRVFLLSGMIDWRLRRLESAEIEFEESITMDGGQCEAATFLGGVRNERGKSREALEAFKAAVRCWDLGIIVRREALRILEASAAPESYKTRGVARYLRDIAQAERRRDEAANGVALLEKYLTSIQGPQTPQRP